MKELATTRKDWLTNTSWIAHVITFGVLLGHPGEEICSALYQNEADSKSGRVIEAKITYADKFDGAQPIYDYLKEVKGSPVPASHQALLSVILEGVYIKLRD